MLILELSRPHIHEPIASPIVRHSCGKIEDLDIELHNKFIISCYALHNGDQIFALPGERVRRENFFKLASLPVGIQSLIAMEVCPNVQGNIVIHHQVEIIRNVVQSFCAVVGIEATAGQRVMTCHDDGLILPGTL